MKFHAVLPLLLAICFCRSTAEAKEELLDGILNKGKIFANVSDQIYRDINRVFCENNVRHLELEPDFENLKVDYGDQNLTASAMDVAFSLTDAKDDLLDILRRITYTCDFNSNTRKSYRRFASSSHANISTRHALDWRYEYYHQMILSSTEHMYSIQQYLKNVQNDIANSQSQVMILQEDFPKVAEKNLLALEVKIRSQKNAVGVNNPLFFGFTVWGNETTEDLLENVKRDSTEKMKQIEAMINKTMEYSSWLKNQTEELVNAQRERHVEKEDLEAIAAQTKNDLRNEIDKYLTYDTSPEAKRLLDQLDAAVDEIGNYCGAYLEETGNDNLSLVRSPIEMMKLDPEVTTAASAA